MIFFLFFCFCLSVLMARDKLMDRSPDTDPQQVNAIFWHLPVAAALFVKRAQSRARLCVCFHRRGRGNQFGLVCSFVFTDKCTGQNRRAIEKYVFLQKKAWEC